MNDVHSNFATELKMGLREPDVKARNINYFMRCDEIIPRQGLASAFSTITAIKEKCKILKKHLDPLVLRDATDVQQSHCRRIRYDG